MTLMLELTPDLEGALAEQARQQGTTPEGFALAGLRTVLGISERSAENARAGLLAAARAGDKDAWYALLEMAPPIAQCDSVTGLPTAAPPREALRRENLYED
ncbi:MAG: hypothetical protein M3Y13_09275 [Armatimonadota bacterium]|nr:hypothetical protein [Armatimonadota bacterium]